MTYSHRTSSELTRKRGKRRRLSTSNFYVPIAPFPLGARLPCPIDRTVITGFNPGLLRDRFAAGRELGGGIAFKSAASCA